MPLFHSSPFYYGQLPALASGMMIAASAGLVLEALDSETDYIHPAVRTAAGFALGVVFIYISKGVLDNYEDLSIGNLTGSDARKALLIMGVMTLHSFSEGLGIGVSFGGSRGSRLGIFISTTLAIHNIPEGLAVSLVLVSKGVGAPYAAIMAVLSSIPQPIMAIPAYIFVEHFIMFLPIGLGFAAGTGVVTHAFPLISYSSWPFPLTRYLLITTTNTGAMLWVTFSELIPESLEELSKFQCLLIMCVSFSLMSWIQFLV
jgi:ZIP family zinc transporter